MTGWMGVSSEYRKEVLEPLKIPEDILFPLFFHHFSLKAYFCRPKRGSGIWEMGIGK
jgi:hypothetical protein